MGTQQFADRPGQPFRRPSRRLFLTEGRRAVLDLAAFAAAVPSICHGPRGDGHAVLVLPGFLADDSSTVVLRSVLAARGLRAAPWRLGRNLGPTRPIVRGCERRLAALHGATGRTVSLVGWSLGGVLARHLARRHPGLVRDVVTLGSPIQIITTDGPDVTWAGRTYDALRPLHTTALDKTVREGERPPLPVPSTAVYSRADGIVPWQACLAPTGPTSENVEVGASHCGLGVDPETLAVVLDRLLQPEGQWRPYRGGHRSAGRAA